MDGDDGNFIIEENPCIEFLELFAVTVSVQLWLHTVKNRTIRLYCDNDAVVKMLRKSSSSCKKCMILIRKITLLCLEYNVKIKAKHVGTKANAISDALSRGQMNRFRRQLRKHKKTVNPLPDHIPQELYPVL